MSDPKAIWSLLKGILELFSVLVEFHFKIRIHYIHYRFYLTCRRIRPLLLFRPIPCPRQEVPWACTNSPDCALGVARPRVAHGPDDKERSLGCRSRERPPVEATRFENFLRLPHHSPLECPCPQSPPKPWNTNVNCLRNFIFTSDLAKHAASTAEQRCYLCFQELSAVVSANSIWNCVKAVKRKKC